MIFIFSIVIFLNFTFPQSILDRLIVPLYLNSEFSYGYDDNYLKLSLPEQESDLEYRLGDSDVINSNIIKNKINILYMPYIFSGHDSKFDFRVTASKYLSSDLKSYNNYYFRFSQHLYPYTWIKLSYSYTPSFYIKSYSQSDPYIIFELNNNYMPSLFSSEKLGFEFSSRIPYLNRMYFSIKYMFESQYYNPDFTEFDLEVSSYYFKIRKKIFDKISISIAYMRSIADNISYMNGLVSTDDKDRGYVQDKIYTSFSMQKAQFLGQNISFGIYSSYENREFLSILPGDKLHYMRFHKDIAVNYWLKKHLNNNFDLKIKAVSRNRDTSSPYDADGVGELKSFQKNEIWLSIIFKMELNVY